MKVIVRNLFLLFVLSLLFGCVTKDKCVWVDMHSDESELNLVTPNTSWMSVSLGSFRVSGKNTYRSCPKGEDPEWMKPISTLTPEEPTK